MTGPIVMTLAVPDRTGAARMQASFAQALIERGYQVRLLHGPPALDDSGDEWSLLSDQRRLGVETVQVEQLRRPVPFSSYRPIARAAAGCAAIVAVNQRDRAAAMAVARKLGVPGIVCAQNQHNFWGRSLLPRLKRTYYGRRIRQGMTLAICTSGVVRDELVTMFGVDPDRCVLLPNGIPTSTDSIDRSGQAETPVELVSVGRLDVQKGYDILLDAWKQSGPVAGAHLRIVGGITPGNSEAASRAYAGGLSEQVERHGLALSVAMEGSRDDVPHVLAEADAYVHSARWEGPALPLSIMEAMERSLPVIMTDCSGWPDGFVEGYHGYVVPSDDVDAMADALRKMIALSAGDRALMGQRCRELILEKYDIDRIGSAFVDHVSRVTV